MTLNFLRNKMFHALIKLIKAIIVQIILEAKL